MPFCYTLKLKGGPTTSIAVVTGILLVLAQGMSVGLKQKEDEGRGGVDFAKLDIEENWKFQDHSDIVSFNHMIILDLTSSNLQVCTILNAVLTVESPAASHAVCT